MYNWQWFKAGRMTQVKLDRGEDIAHLCELDKKYWLAISMPVAAVRFDKRMLELMDTDHDGRIRTAEVIAAIEFLKAKNVNLDELFKPSDADKKALDEIVAKQQDLAKAVPTKADKEAMAAWEAKGKTQEVAFLGENTAAANGALAAVEGIIDAFFTVPEDMPLVTDEQDKTLPLKDRINPKYLEAILDFSEKCVKPILGEKESIDRLEWKSIKGRFTPYRDWVNAKPVMNAGVKAKLDDEERLLRYKLNLLEFLENYVNMARLYDEEALAIFQTGTLRIDAKELNLCFHVDSEAAHSALAEKSKCCVIYLKLSRPAEKLERSICSVVTAGAIRGLYVGRNGVFYDRDGKDWEAVVTKVVESEVSLLEAFWAPWRKLGEGIASSVKKFLGEKQTNAQAKLDATSASAQAGGAAMASSVAAIGIGVGMMGAALASIMAAVSKMNWWQLLVSIGAVILVVSLPSSILTWFKLRQRDIGAILNASGWAINRKMRFSMKRARSFTKCACDPLLVRTLIVLCVVLALIIGGTIFCKARKCRAQKCKAQECKVEERAQIAENAIECEEASASTQEEVIEIDEDTLKKIAE